MPLLLPPGTRLLDDDGNPLNDAGVRVYLQNTTSYASLYSDPGLTIPLSNPVITNAAGYPTSDGSNECLIFVASGDYDVAFLNSGGSVIVNFDDAPTFGEEAGELDRTVSGNGRFKVTGAAGAVKIQVGDPDPDNSGGTLTISGWSDTQGDTLTLNFALVNISGRLKENSKKIPSVVYTEATTFTAASTVEIELPNDPSGVRSWEIEVFDFFQSVAGSIRGRFSYDGGANYKAGATDYDLGRVGSGTNGWTTGGGTTAQMDFTITSQTPTNKPGFLRFWIITPNSGSDATVLRSDALAYDNSGTAKLDLFTASHLGLGGYGRATHLRLLNAAGGTLSGKYLVRPLRGFGET